MVVVVVVFFPEVVSPLAPVSAAMSSEEEVVVKEEITWRPCFCRMVWVLYFALLSSCSINSMSWSRDKSEV